MCKKALCLIALCCVLVSGCHRTTVNHVATPAKAPVAQANPATPAPIPTAVPSTPPPSPVPTPPPSPQTTHQPDTQPSLPPPMVQVSPQAPPAPTTGVLQGQIFIATKGGQNYKLGAVSVGLYDLQTMQAYTSQRQIEYNNVLNQENQKLSSADADEKADDAAEKAALQRMTAMAYDDPNRQSANDAWMQEMDIHNKAIQKVIDILEEKAIMCSGDFFFPNLPSPITSTQTDADGKFSIQLPTQGEFALAARSQRSVGDETERYAWIIRVSLDGMPQKSIMLTNSNLSSENAPESLIHTE